MKRVEGATNVVLLECINPIRNRWHLRWDVQKNGEDGAANYMETMFPHRPSTDEIKSTILGWYNSEVNAKILSGFVWNNIPVWLSQENQSNFKATYDLAYQTSGEILPVKFKLGEDLEGNPLYFTFKKMEMLTDFYTKAMKHIQDTLSDGWEMKDAFNPEDYKVE